MTKNEVTFETWFDNLQLIVFDKAHVSFRDEAAARDFYNKGRNVFDVADEISTEFSCEGD